MILLQQIANGLLGSGIYALFGVGFTMIFGIMRVLNMAHADFGMVTALAVVWAIAAGLSPIAGIAFAIAITLVVAVSVERVAIRPSRRFKGDAAVEMPLIATIGVGMILQNVAALIVGNKGVFFPFLLDSFVSIGGILVIEGLVVSAIVAAVLLVLLELFVQRTGFGRQVRAVAQNPEAARIMGINPNLVIMTTMAITGLLAGISGCLVGLSYGLVSPSMGIALALKGLVAMIIGGIGSLWGAVLGAMIIGFTEAIAVNYFGSQSRDVSVFFVLMLLLAFKPRGLFPGRGAS